jgi:hypothetical protein
MSDWHGSSWSSNQSWEGNNSHLEEDLQESRGRRAREGRKARRAADAGVQERRGWHEQGWVANHEPMPEMTPGSQRWRRLKELERTVNFKDRETAARTEACNIAAAQLAQQQQQHHAMLRERDQAWHAASYALQVQRAQQDMEVKQQLHQLNMHRRWLEQQHAELQARQDETAANEKQRVDLTAWMRKLETQRASQEEMAQALQKQREELDKEMSILSTASVCTHAIVEQLKKDQQDLLEREERLMQIKWNAPWRKSKVMDPKRVKVDEHREKNDDVGDEETPVPTTEELEALRAMRLVSQPRHGASSSSQASEETAGPLPPQVCLEGLPLQRNPVLHTSQDLEEEC